jgi:hypothetical protein
LATPEQKSQTPPTDWEKRYKDAQAALTKAQQELAERKKQETQPPPKKEGDEAPKEGDDKPKEGDEAPKEGDDKSKVEVPEEAKEAHELTQKAGLDWTAVNEEFARDGKLSDKSYEALNKIGISREMIDSYTAGQVALRDAKRNEVLSAVGGADEYAKVVQWAAESLKPDEIAGFNAIVNGRDLNATKTAVAGLKARYDASVGKEPDLIQGDSSRQTGFASMDELKAAQRDPRYAKDPAYRAQVEAKLRVSSF